LVDQAAASEARSRARGRRLRAAVASSVLSKVGSFGYQILGVPIVIAALGSGGYSQFAVALAAFGWLGSLFAALSGPVTERIASDRSRPLSAETRGTFVTALVIAGTLIAILLVLEGIVLVSRPTEGSDYSALAVAGLATGLTMGGGLFDAALLGLQRSYVTNVLSFASSLGAVVASVVAAVVAPTVAAMVLATLGPVVFARAVSGLVLRRLESSLRGGLRDVRLRRAPAIAGRGLAFAGISFASFLSLDAGLLVVAGQLGSSRVAEVALVVRGLPLLLSVVGMIIVPLWPAITEAAASGDVHWIARAGGRATLFVMGYAVAGALIIVVGGDRIVSLWTGGRISIPFEILVATGAVLITLSLENLTQSMLFGLGRAGTVAAVLLFQGLISIGLVFLLAAPLGQVAVLVAPIIAALLTSSWLLPLLVIRGFRARARMGQPPMADAREGASAP
jgi:O-antigen/teichoic acid export membrane protein